MAADAFKALLICTEVRPPGLGNVLNAVRPSALCFRDSLLGTPAQLYRAGGEVDAGWSQFPVDAVGLITVAAIF